MKVTEGPFIVNLEINCVDEHDKFDNICEIGDFSDDHAPQQVFSDSRAKNVTILKGEEILKTFMIKPLPDTTMENIRLKVIASYKGQADEEGNSSNVEDVIDNVIRIEQEDISDDVSAGMTYRQKTFFPYIISFLFIISRL